MAAIDWAAILVQPQTPCAKRKDFTRQQTGRLANMTISFLDPFPWTAMTIGRLGRDQLREILLAAAFRQNH
jgi:hypothetical protein